MKPIVIIIAAVVGFSVGGMASAVVAERRGAPAVIGDTDLSPPPGYVDGSIGPLQVGTPVDDGDVHGKVVDVWTRTGVPGGIYVVRSNIPGAHGEVNDTFFEGVLESAKAFEQKGMSLRRSELRSVGGRHVATIETAGNGILLRMDTMSAGNEAFAVNGMSRGDVAAHDAGVEKTLARIADLASARVPLTSFERGEAMGRGGMWGLTLAVLAAVIGDVVWRRRRAVPSH